MVSAWEVDVGFPSAFFRCANADSYLSPNFSSEPLCAPLLDLFLSARHLLNLLIVFFSWIAIFSSAASLDLSNISLQGSLALLLSLFLRRPSGSGVPVLI